MGDESQISRGLAIWSGSQLKAYSSELRRVNPGALVAVMNARMPRSAGVNPAARYGAQFSVPVQAATTMLRSAEGLLAESPGLPYD